MRPGRSDHNWEIRSPALGNRRSRLRGFLYAPAEGPASGLAIGVVVVARSAGSRSLKRARAAQRLGVLFASTQRAA